MKRSSPPRHLPAHRWNHADRESVPGSSGCHKREHHRTGASGEKPGHSLPGGECDGGGGRCRKCPLDCLRVAVVGGLDRMQPVYRAILGELGAEPLFHDGKLGKGCHRLRSMICGADIVVFITSINSHGALQVVKGICKKSGKTFIALKETGAESLARTLKNWSS